MTVMTIMDMINIAGIIRPYPQSSDMPCVCYTCIRVSALTFIFEIIRRESLMIRTSDKLRHSDPYKVGVSHSHSIPRNGECKTHSHSQEWGMQDEFPFPGMGTAR
jgi:hypothetical protein